MANQVIPLPPDDASVFDRGQYFRHFVDLFRLPKRSSEKVFQIRYGIAVCRSTFSALKLNGKF